VPTPGSFNGWPYCSTCVSDPNDSGWQGYSLYASSDTSITLISNGAFSGATYTVPTMTDGAGIGMRYSPSAGTMEVWCKQSASDSWALVDTAETQDYLGGGIGLGWYSAGTNTPPITSFGGGSTGVPQQAFTQAKRGLYLQVCDLDGNPIAHASGHPLPVSTVDQPQVTIPLSDSRTGQFDVSMFEPIAAALANADPDTGEVSAGQVVVKVMYVNPKGHSVLVLNGILMNPEANFDDGTVTCQLHDSTIRLKKRNLGYNHYSIMLTWGTEVSDGDVDDLTGGDFNGVTSNAGIPLDGTGLRLILLDVSHGAKDWRGWPLTTSDPFPNTPAMGIRYDPDNSVDNANRQPLYITETVNAETFYLAPTGVGGLLGGETPGTGFTAQATEGSAVLTNVDFTDATQSAGGTPTMASILEYMALSGPGVAEFAQVVSTDSGAHTITMSKDATGNSDPATTGLNAYVAQDAIYCTLTRGDGAWDDITDMVQAQGAFECDWVPVDADHKGFSGADWAPGQLCELYTANRVGNDRSKGNADGNTPVQFVHGQGGFHLVWSPDADSLNTYDVEVGPGGPGDPNDFFNKIEKESNTVDTYGFWEQWNQATSAGNGDSLISNSVLADRARANLTAFRHPPQFITATIDTDTIGAYCYGTDFFLGDTVTVYAKRGYVEIGPVDVRITEIGISRIDADGNCQLSLTMVPYLTANPGVNANEV